MKRVTRFVYGGLVGAALAVAVLSFRAGNVAAGALAIALAAWIVYAALVRVELAAARRDRQRVIDSWREYSASGLNALERARRVREHAQRDALFLVHAIDRPCGSTGGAVNGDRVAGADLVICPLCVSITEGAGQ